MPGQARHRRGMRLSIAGFLLPFLLPFTAFFVLPILYTVYRSFLLVERGGPLGLGGARRVFGGLQNYAWALTDAGYLESFGRVLLFAIVQIPLMMLGATVLAFLLDSASVRWPAFFRVAYFLPYGVPGVIASILWGYLYTPGMSPVTALFEAIGLPIDFLGEGTVLWSIANILLWTVAGYKMLIIIAQLKSIDGTLYEAARIDGASGWQIALKIKLPLVRPALILGTVFSIIGTLQLFAEPLLLRPLSGNISAEYTPNMSAYTEAFANTDYGLAAAQSVLLALLAFGLSFGFLTLVGRRDAP